MRTMLLILALMGLATLNAEEKKPAAPAKVRIAGMITGARDVEMGDKKSYTGTFYTKHLEFDVKSSGRMSNVFTDALGAKVKLITNKTDAMVKILKDKNLDAEGKKKAIKEMEAKSKEQQESVAVAEGTIAVGKKVVLTGSVRLTDFDKVDKDLPIRGAMVEGEAAPAGKEKAAFAIRNGDGLILVTGAAAGKERKGRVRAYGYLQLGEKGLVLEATKIEEVK